MFRIVSVGMIHGRRWVRVWQISKYNLMGSNMSCSARPRNLGNPTHLDKFCTSWPPPCLPWCTPHALAIFVHFSHRLPCLGVPYTPRQVLHISATALLTLVYPACLNKFHMSWPLPCLPWCTPHALVSFACLSHCLACLGVPRTPRQVSHVSTTTLLALVYPACLGKFRSSW